MGGAFNLVGDAVAFNFGYFEGGNWTSPPVTIGPDPMTLLYHDAELRSPDSQGKGQLNHPRENGAGAGVTGRWTSCLV